MHVEPFPPDTPLFGEGTPKIEGIDDLIRYLVTVRERFGNTCVTFQIRWGGCALGAKDADKRRIERLLKQVAALKKKAKK